MAERQKWLQIGGFLRGWLYNAHLIGISVFLEQNSIRNSRLGVVACRSKLTELWRIFSEDVMKARVKWVENTLMVGESGSGHAVVMDGPPDMGGQNLGVRPMEMMLLGLGGCTQFDVVHILRKGRHQVTRCEVELEAERAETEPKVFTRIHVHFIVSGPGLTEKVVERAVKLSAEKYCSASLMLGQVVDITHDFEVVSGE